MQTKTDRFQQQHCDEVRWWYAMSCYEVRCTTRYDVWSFLRAVGQRRSNVRNRCWLLVMRCRVRRTSVHKLLRPSEPSGNGLRFVEPRRRGFQLGIFNAFAEKPNAPKTVRDIVVRIDHRSRRSRSASRGTLEVRSRAPGTAAVRAVAAINPAGWPRTRYQRAWIIITTPVWKAARRDSNRNGWTEQCMDRCARA